MKILLLGSGAREHALARALACDPQTSELVVAPGNPGTAAIATNLNIDPCAPEEVVALATQMGADLVVVGPEAPLVAGVADAVRDAGIPCFGPGAEAARLEGSKAFAKEVMAAAGVPTAQAAVCASRQELEAALDRFGALTHARAAGLVNDDVAAVRFILGIAVVARPLPRRAAETVPDQAQWLMGTYLTGLAPR